MGAGGKDGKVDLPARNLPTPPTTSNTPLKMSPMKMKKPLKRLRMPETNELVMAKTVWKREEKSSRKEEMRSVMALVMAIFAVV